MTLFVESTINGRWPLWLPDFKAEFHEARPDWEQGRLASCVETMRPGAVVWDVGAEQGDFTALYRSWVGESGYVVAIEPSPPYWPMLRTTWDVNQFGTPPGWCVGFAADKTEPAPRSSVRDAPVDGWPECAWGELQPDFGFRHLVDQQLETPQYRLDELPFPHPDVVTIDIEGAEWHALAGAEGLLTGDRPPIVYVSIHDRPLLTWYDRTFLDVHRLMLSYGYDGTFLPYHDDGELFWRYDPR